MSIGLDKNEGDLLVVEDCSDTEDTVIEKVHHNHQEVIRHISPLEAARQASIQQLYLMQKRLITRPIQTDHFPLVEAHKLQKCGTIPEDDALRFYPLRHAKLDHIKLISFHFWDHCTCHQHGKHMLHQLAQEGWESTRGYVSFRLNSQKNTICVLCNDDLLVDRVVLGSGSCPEWPVSVDLALKADQKAVANVWIWLEELPQLVQGIPFWGKATKNGTWGWLTLVASVMNSQRMKAISEA